MSQQPFLSSLRPVCVCMLPSGYCLLTADCAPASSLFPANSTIAGDRRTETDTRVQSCGHRAPHNLCTSFTHPHGTTMQRREFNSQESRSWSVPGIPFSCPQIRGQNRPLDQPAVPPGCQWPLPRQQGHQRSFGEETRSPTAAGQAGEVGYKSASELLA